MPKLPFPRLSHDNPPTPHSTEPPPPQDDGHNVRMGFFEHLDELRRRVMWAVIALVIGTLIGTAFASPALEYLREPYCQVVAFNEAAARGEEIAYGTVPANTDCSFVALGPTSSIVAYFRIALLIGAMIAIPVITYQLLLFIFPGLTHKEKRLVLYSLPAITILFLVGVAFAWFVLMPPALGFLEGFQANLFRSEWTADLYLSFVTSLLFWMGVSFETPLVFFVLAILGLVESGPLVRHWRIAVVISAIAAAAITPTVDPVNMFLVMGPLLMLYVLSIGLVFIARRISRRSQ